MERAVTRALCMGLLLMMVFGPGMDSRAEGATTTLIVKMAQGVSPADAEATILRHGGTLKSSIAPLRMYVIEVPVEATETIITNLQKDPNVERVELDQSRKVSAAPTDALYSTQWSLSKIKWDEVYGNVSPIAQADIAVLDTGIDASHPDLVGAIGPGTSFVDSSQGRTDLNGHGTWVSGIVAGRTNNFDGIAGVAYSNVQILPVKVLNAAGEGQDSDIISGIMWAIDHRASVILMAFSNPGFSQNLQDAIDYAWSQGIVLVAAAGNDNSSAAAFPAGDKSVIGVSATDENDLFATGSNYGPAVFMAAPGTNIVSTYKDGGYITWSGTSASAALVAGAAAFMRAVDPSLTNGAVVGRLARNADPAGLQSETGNGRLQIARAIADTATDEVRPIGAPPVGDGGPFVGPYRAAARNFEVTFAGTGSGSVTISVSPTGADATNTLTLNGCAGSGDGTSSVTISATCTSLRSGNGNDATLIFTASPNGGSTFSGWSAANALSSSTCTGTTNPCSAILGGNARLTVNLNANTAPTAASAAVSTAEDTPLLITLSGTDTDPAALAFSLVSGPGAAAGSLTAIGTPSCSAGTCTADVTFTPSANYNGPASFTFKTNDGFLDSTTATVSIAVTPVNDAPVAGNASFGNAEDGGAVAIDLGALVSDLETSDSNLTYNIVTPPASGTLSGTGANKTFTPAANFNGQVTFTYSVTDSGDPDACAGGLPACAGALTSNNATVTITITPVNDAPVANNSSFDGAEDGGAVPVDLAPAVTDQETTDGNLAYNIVTPPSTGTLTGTGPNFNFTPAANFNGEVTFTYNVTDRGDPDNCAPGDGCAAALTSNTATVTIAISPVNDAPTAGNESFTAAEDGGAVAIDLGTLVADLETTDGNLTYNILTPPSSGTLSGTGPNKTYTPPANFNGQVMFTYSVTDGGDPDACSGGLPDCADALTSNTATVTITITPVNDRPAASDSSATVPEDNAAGVGFDLSTLVDDVETDNAFLSYDIVAGPTAAQGTLTGTGSTRTFTPAANFNGTVLITYNVTDRGDPDNCTPGAGCAATQTSETKTITIAVTPVNDAPTAANDSFTGAEDGGALAIDLGSLVADLETADGNLTYNILTSPSTGTLSGTGPNKTYTPPANFNGQVTFTYSVTDGGDPDACSGGLPDCADALTSNTATVTITITPVNDRPTASDSSATVPEDSAPGVGFDLSTLVDDVETDNAFLSYDIIAGPTPAQGTLTGTGSTRTFTPAANFNGTVLITYNVTDRGDPDNCTPGAGCAATQTSETKTITIAVTPVNDAPTAANDSFTGAEDGGALAIDLGTLVADLETTDGNLTYNILTPPSSGTLSGTGPNKTYTPPANFNGQVTFTYSVTDGGDPDACSGGLPDCADALTSNTATVTITITPVNDRPTASGSSATVAEDSAAGVGFDLSTLVDDVETDNASLTYDIVTGPTAAQGTLTGSGSSRTFTPASNFNGTVLISYNVTDRGDPDNCSPGPGCAAAQTSETKTVTITVTPVNDIPTANDGEFTGDEDTNIAINLAGLVVDLETADGNLFFSIESGPTSGTLTPGATPGTYTYLGAPNFFGDVTFTYKVTDRGDPDNCGAVSSTCAATENSATKTITIHVSAVNDPAIVLDSGDASAQYSDTPAPTVTITATDVDNPGSALTLTSIQVDGGGASGLTATISSTDTNSRTWTIGGRALLAPGSHTVRVNISDGLIDSYVEWTLTVTREDAGLNYSGVIFFSTSSVSANTGTATLTATVTDDNDGAAIRGDIRKAKVTFMNRDTNLPFAGCVNLPVGLVNPANLTVGTATCQTTLSTGSQDSMTYTVGILVDDHYTRNAGADNELVTIYKPIGTYFITGGGYLSLYSPAGQLAGDVYSKNNFGYNVKYNKSGKNLQGNFNSIVRSDGRVYQIKATSMETLNVNPAAGCPNASASAPCTAVFTSKANMTDITDPLRPVPVAGNLILQVTMTDKGQPGNADSIGISVFNQNGGLLFSSSWNGVQTVEQFLAGGNQVVH